MINLSDYGFTQTRTSDKWTEYEGHGFRLTIFDYLYKNIKGSEIHKKSFTVNTKETSSIPFPLEELEHWLKNKNINKTL